MANGKPLWRGDSEIDQLYSIFQCVGLVMSRCACAPRTVHLFLCLRVCGGC
jgi:hypothetical protein